MQLEVKNPIKQLQPITLLDPGKIVEIAIHVSFSQISENVAKSGANHAKTEILKLVSDCPVTITLSKDTKTHGQSIIITMIGKSSTACLYGRSASWHGKKEFKEKRFFKEVSKKVNELLGEIKLKSCVDEYVFSMN